MLIKVKTYPGSKKNQIKINNDLLKVYLTSQPEKGKANKQLTKLLSGHFAVSKSRISIVKGEKNRQKTIYINKEQKYLGKMHSWNR